MDELQDKQASADKAEVLDGFGDMVNLYVTITNDEAGQPFEVFLNCSDQNLYEWLTAIMLLISSMLHGGGLCPSLPARIGLLLEQHYMNRCPVP